DEPEPAEVVPLGQHLGADKEIDLPAVHRVEHRLGGAAPASDIAVQPRDARAGERLRQRLLESLGPAAEGLQVGVAAGRAFARHGLLAAAMVADETKAG